MLFTSIYHMLSKSENFHPDDYEATVNPKKQKPVILTLNNTLQFLREQGADPETLKLIQQQCTAQTEKLFKKVFSTKGEVRPKFRL